MNGSANEQGQITTFELRGALHDGIVEAAIQEPLLGGPAVVYARAASGRWGTAPMRPATSLLDALERAAAAAVSP